MGRAYVNGERKKALSKALTGAQQDIEDLANNLVVDNNEISNMVDGYGRSYVYLAQQARPQKAHDKIRAYDASVLQIYKMSKDLKAAFMAQDKAIKLLPEAHKALLTSLDDPKAPLARLEDFVGATEQALVLMKSLRNN